MTSFQIFFIVSVTVFCALAAGWWFWVQSDDSDTDLVDKKADTTTSSPAVTSSTIVTFKVGSEQFDCEAQVTKKCLLVNGDYFSDEIKGFIHEPGFMYELRVRQSQVSESTYSYELVEMVSKTRLLGSNPLTPAAEPITDLIGKWQWTVTTYTNGEQVTPSEMFAEAFTIHFDPDTLRMAVTTDCNNGFATYETSGNVLSIGSLATTKRACLLPSQESEFFQMLSLVRSYTVDGTQLTLTLGEGQTQSGVMTLAAVVN